MEFFKRWLNLKQNYIQTSNYWNIDFQNEQFDGRILDTFFYRTVHLQFISTIDYSLNVHSK